MYTQTHIHMPKFSFSLFLSESSLKTMGRYYLKIFNWESSSASSSKQMPAQKEWMPAIKTTGTSLTMHVY